MKNKIKRRILLVTGVMLMTVSLFTVSCSENGVLKPKENSTTSANVLQKDTTRALQKVLPGGIDPGRADAAIEGFNDAFLATDSGGNTYYQVAMNDNTRDETWTFALDIQAMEDVYVRTGSSADRDLINDLGNGFLAQNPPPYDWDGWNDDIAWMGLAMIRAYHITGYNQFLENARNDFDYVWDRGWDTEYNDGGIWEEQPDYTSGELLKEALSNNTTGRLAAMIYQSNGDQWYLDRAHDIYDWSWHHLYNPNTGQVYRGVHPDGTTDESTAVYSQGSFIGFANVMHEITGNSTYLNDAIRAVDYTKNNMTRNGIITTDSQGFDTWGDELARGLGKLCMNNPELWDDYGDWMVQNANAIWNNRRTDYNLTWNAWDRQTPEDDGTKVTHYISAIAWLQYTPVSSGGGSGSIESGATYSIISKNSGKAMDVEGASTQQGANVLQWTDNNAGNQRWVVSSVGNDAYSVINENSGMSLDLEGGGTDNGTNILQWGWHSGDNQKWYLQPDGEGYYSIISVASGKAIDVEAGSTEDGANVLEWESNDQDNQKWSFVP